MVAEGIYIYSFWVFEALGCNMYILYQGLYKSRTIVEKSSPVAKIG